MFWSYTAYSVIVIDSLVTEVLCVIASLLAYGKAAGLDICFYQLWLNTEHKICTNWNITSQLG